MTDPQNLLPGLHEALRLMALNDLDYAPGTIMKRIEQLEGEVVETSDLDNTISSQQQQITHLKSELEKSRSDLHTSEQRVKELVVALQTTIQGKPALHYIVDQFPCCQGNMPLKNYFSTLHKAIGEVKL